MKILFLLMLCVILASCSPGSVNLQPVFTPDNCFGVETQEDPETGRSYAFLTCEDGRYVISWTQRQEDGSTIRFAATRKGDGSYAIGYYQNGGLVEWSPKSGLMIEWLPPEVERAGAR